MQRIDLNAVAQRLIHLEEGEALPERMSLYAVCTDGSKMRVHAATASRNWRTPRGKSVAHLALQGEGNASLAFCACGAIQSAPCAACDICCPPEPEPAPEPKVTKVTMANKAPRASKKAAAKKATKKVAKKARKTSKKAAAKKASASKR